MQLNNAKGVSLTQVGSCVLFSLPERKGHRLGVRGLFSASQNCFPSFRCSGWELPAQRFLTLPRGLVCLVRRVCLGTDLDQPHPVWSLFSLLSITLIWGGGEAARIGFEAVIKISTCLRQTIVD